MLYGVGLPKTSAAAAFLLAVLSFAFLASLPSAAYATGTSAVTCGATITVSTKLKTDLSCAGYGIIVGATGITLNCAGHTLTGSGVKSGIELKGVTQVIVKNCTVKGFDFGFNLTSSSHDRLIGNTAVFNSVGFSLVGSSRNKLASNTAVNDSFVGFQLTNSSKNALTSDTGTHNGYAGFFLNAGSTGNKLTSNIADGNFGFGYVDQSSGSGTLGTANTYSLDECSNNENGGSQPSGLGSPQF